MKYPAKVVKDKNNNAKTVRTTLKESTLKVDNKAHQQLGQIPLQKIINNKK